MPFQQTEERTNTHISTTAPDSWLSSFSPIAYNVAMLSRIDGWHSLEEEFANRRR